MIASKPPHRHGEQQAADRGKIAGLVNAASEVKTFEIEAAEINKNFNLIEERSIP